MSGSKTTILILAIACIAFFSLGALFDRDVMFLPLQTGDKSQEYERLRILETIQTYNSIATDLYVTSGVPKLLDELPATKAIRHELFRDIGYIRENAQVLVYDMAQLQPVSIHVSSPRTADAVVFEEWNYQYKQKSGMVPVSRLKGLGQGFRYRLRKEQGAWIIYSYDPVAVEDPVSMPSHK